MSLLRSSLWATAGNWGQQIFALVTMVVVARLLDPSAFGVIAIAMLFVLLFQRILLESIGFGVIRVEEEYYDKSFLDSSFWVALIVGGTLALAMFFFARPLAVLFGEPALEPVLRVMSAMPLIDALGVVQIGILRRELKFKVLALRTIGSNFLSGIAGIGLAFAGFGVWSLVTQQLVAALGSLIALWLTTGWTPGREWSNISARRVCSFGFPMLGNAILFVAANRLDVAAIASVGGASSTGVYHIAKRVSRSVSDFLMSGASSVSLSAFSMESKDEAQRKNTLRSQLRVIFWIVSPFYLLLEMLAEDMVLLIFGAAWLGVVDPLKVLCFVGMLQTIYVVGTNYLISLGDGRGVLLLNLGSLLVLALSLIILAEGGALGVSQAVLVQYIIMMPFIVWYFSRGDLSVLVGVSKSILSVVGSLLGMYFFTQLIFSFFANVIIAPLIRILVFSVLALVVYLGASIVFNRDLVLSVFRLVRGRVA